MSTQSPFTDRQIQLVQDSFTKIAPISDQAGVMFYTRLFELDPSLEPMFKGDIDAQAQKLMQTLAAAIAGLRDLDRLAPVLQQLGVDHVKYGVLVKHYDTVGEALLWTLAEGLGEDFTPEVAEAWTEVYTVVAKTMKDAAYANT